MRSLNLSGHVRRLSAAVAVLMIGGFLAAPVAQAAPSPNPDVVGKTFAIATDTTFAPFEFRDTSGELTGIDMDLIREVAERGGFTVDIKSVGFDAALQSLQSGQVAGVIAGMSITDERKADLRLLRPVLRVRHPDGGQAGLHHRVLRGPPRARLSSPRPARRA